MEKAYIYFALIGGCMNIVDRSSLNLFRSANPQLPDREEIELPIRVHYSPTATQQPLSAPLWSMPPISFRSLTTRERDPFFNRELKVVKNTRHEASYLEKIIIIIMGILYITIFTMPVIEAVKLYKMR